MTNEKTLRWLGEVEGRMVVRDPVTPAERVAVPVRRALVDAGGGWSLWPTKRAERPVARAVRRKVQHLRARGWSSEKIRARAFDHVLPFARSAARGGR